MTFNGRPFNPRDVTDDITRAYVETVANKLAERIEVLASPDEASQIAINAEYKDGQFSGELSGPEDIITRIKAALSEGQTDSGPPADS